MNEGINKCPTTAFYNKNGTYVVVDDVTGEVIQVSDKRIDPSEWIPDSEIIDP